MQEVALLEIYISIVVTNWISALRDSQVVGIIIVLISGYVLVSDVQQQRGVCWAYRSLGMRAD